MGHPHAERRWLTAKTPPSDLAPQPPRQRSSRSKEPAPKSERSKRALHSGVRQEPDARADWFSELVLGLHPALLVGDHRLTIRLAVPDLPIATPDPFAVSLGGSEPAGLLLAAGLHSEGRLLRPPLQICSDVDRCAHVFGA